MSIIAVICWAGFVSIIYYLNPATAGRAGYLLFYSSIFLATVATLSVFGFSLRRRLLTGELALRQVAITFRQAFWFGLLVVAALGLQARDLLTWWNLLILLVALTVLEFFFLSLRNKV